MTFQADEKLAVLWVIRHIHEDPDQVVAEVPAEVLLCPEVDAAPAKKLRELPLHAGNRNQARRVTRLELDKEIDVAVGTIGALGHRPEESEPPHVVAPTERRERVRIFEQKRGHGSRSSNVQQRL